MYIPKFSVDVEYRLCQANLLHLSDGTHIIPSKELKHDILERLAETIYALKAYPTNAEFEAVALALVGAQPCLKELCVSAWLEWLEKQLEIQTEQKCASGVTVMSP